MDKANPISRKETLLRLKDRLLLRSDWAALGAFAAVFIVVALSLALCARPSVPRGPIPPADAPKAEQLVPPSPPGDRPRKIRPNREPPQPKPRRTQGSLPKPRGPDVSQYSPH